MYAAGAAMADAAYSFHCQDICRGEARVNGGRVMRQVRFRHLIVEEGGMARLELQVQLSAYHPAKLVDDGGHLKGCEQFQGPDNPCRGPQNGEVDSDPPTDPGLEYLDHDLFPGKEGRGMNLRQRRSGKRDLLERLVHLGQRVAEGRLRQGTDTGKRDRREVVEEAAELLAIGLGEEVVTGGEKLSHLDHPATRGLEIPTNQTWPRDSPK